MTFKLPEFHIARVLDDGTHQDAEIVPVIRMPWDTSMGRRGALGVGIGLAGVVGMIGRMAAAADPPLNEPDHCISPRQADAVRAHVGGVRALALAPDESFLASAGYDGKVKLWSFPVGDLLRTLDVGSSAHLVVVTPDNQAIVAAGGTVVRSWSARNGRVRSSFSYDNPVDTLAVTPDGQYVIASEGSAAHISSLRGSTRPHSLPHDDRITALLVEPTGRFLLSASTQVLKFWSLPAGAGAGVVDHGDRIACVATTVDGNVAASGGHDHRVRLWSVPAGESLASLGGHIDSVVALAFSPDGRLLASAGHDNAVKLWSVPDGKLLASMAAGADTGWIRSLRVTLDGKTLVYQDGSNVTLWPLPSGKPAVTFRALAGSGGDDANAIESFATKGDGSVVAVGNVDGSITLWSPRASRSRLGCLIASLSDPIATPPSQRAVTRAAASGGSTTPAPKHSHRQPPPAPHQRRHPEPRGPLWQPQPVPFSAPVPGGSYGGSYCSCNKVCTCVPVYSSRRWKANVRSLDGALAQVKRLRGVRFDWTAEAPHRATGPDLGVIAEEVAQVVPEVVARDDRGAPIAVDYARLTTLLIEAIKAQQRQIDVLRREVRRRRDTSSSKVSAPGRR